MFRRFLALSALVALAACDSMPGSMDPEPEGPARLIVKNTGSRVITSVEMRTCSGQFVKWTRTEIGPGRTWSRGYEPGCYGVSFDFNSGGGWTGSVQLTESAPATLNPW